MATPSAARLRHLIDNRFPESTMVFVDLFAMGCLLHLQGQRRAGLKLIREVRRAVEEPGQKTYFNDLIDHLAGNEQRFATEINAHSEVNELFELEHGRPRALEQAGGA